MSNELALQELSKFLTVAAGREFEAYMFSPAVDGAWHELVEDSSKYESFCSTFGVKQLRHVEAEGSGRIPWIEEYHARFGPLPDIWFRDADNVLNWKLYQDYMNGVEIHACWDCRAMPMPDAVQPLQKPKIPGQKEKPSQQTAE